MSAQASAEARLHLRTNTMLAATLEFDGETQNVFVRNLSVAGALIEGRALPEQGERVVLNRSDYKIEGTVMWRAEGRCGLSFARLVKVDDLISRGKGTAAPIHQARVDAIQRALREQLPIPNFAERVEPIGAPVGKSLATEIGYAQRLVETVNEALANDTYVLSRHGVILQQLDEAEQLLRKLVTEASGKAASGAC